MEQIRTCLRGQILFLQDAGRRIDAPNELLLLSQENESAAE